MKALKGQNKRRQAEVVDNAESALAQRTRFNTLQRIATHCYTATQCDALQCTAAQCRAEVVDNIESALAHMFALQHAATH